MITHECLSGNTHRRGVCGSVSRGCSPVRVITAWCLGGKQSANKSPGEGNKGRHGELGKVWSRVLTRLYCAVKKFPLVHTEATHKANLLTLRHEQPDPQLNTTSLRELLLYKTATMGHLHCKPIGLIGLLAPRCHEPTMLFAPE